MINFYQLSEGDSATVALIFGVHRTGKYWHGARGEPLSTNIAPHNARKWSDLLHSDQYDMPLLSERWLAAAKEDGWTGVEFWPVQIREIESSRLRQLPHPNYYWPRLQGKKTAAGTSSRGEPLVYSDRYGALTCPSISRIKARLKTFHGDDTDFFSLANLHSSSIFCSERVKRRAEKDKWTNVSFIHPGKDADGDFFLV